MALAKHVWLTMALSIVFVPAMAGAQSGSSGAIAGVVKDTTGSVLPGVTVEASSPALIEKVRTAVTDDHGEYKIVELRPGAYAVTFTLTGFSTIKHEGIELTAGFTATVNADLPVGALAETVTVSGGSPIVDTHNVRSQNLLTRDNVDSLPTFRTIQGFAALTVGATANISGGGQDVGGSLGEAFGHVVIHGSSATDGQLQIDGMSFNYASGSIGGNSRQYFVNQGAMQEVVVETAGLSPEALSGGVTLNYVPKDGANTFSVYFNTSYSHHDLVQSNLTPELRAFGLSEAKIKQVWDYNGGLGGPVFKDRLWFYTGHRWWGTQQYAPGNFTNGTHGTPFYTPDASQAGFTNFHQEDHSLRLTWQAAPKHKITISDSIQKSCACNWGVQYGTQAPDAVMNLTYMPIYLVQSTWNYPATTKLLLEGGATYLKDIFENRLGPIVSPTDISITDISRNYVYNAYAGPPGSLISLANYGQHEDFSQHNERFTLSYVTGSHAFKTGFQTLSGNNHLSNLFVNQALSYQFLGQTPIQLTEWASPVQSNTDVKLMLGLFAQDQWTLQRLTLNYGLRFDYLNAYVPTQVRPAGRFTPAIPIAEIRNVPNFKDVNPRIGGAYDLFGNGKTSIKAFVGRYVVAQGSGIAQNVNPANSVVISTTRTWNDANRNFQPDCDLPNQDGNGECGPISNRAFGTVNVNTVYDPTVTSGWGARSHDWQTSVSVQQELFPRVALTAGYFRSWYGGFTATQNLLAPPSAYSPYCITAPMDSRLPGGGGYQICGLYDINPQNFGRVSNVVYPASQFGEQRQVTDFIDIDLNARLWKGGRVAGGVSTGQIMTDNCFVVNSPQQLYLCHQVNGWWSQTQFKLNVSYPLPWWDIKASGVLQNLPGFPLQASYVATNAAIAPSLGRNLGQCGSAAVCNGFTTINLLTPFTMFEPRLNQLDIRLTKVVRLGQTSVQGMFDIYNALNASTVLGANTQYGPNWQRPTQVLTGRMFKFGAQLTF